MTGALVKAGLSRVKVGAIDFSSKVQECAGRAQSLERTQSVVHWLRAEASVNVDVEILFGLPLQTTESLEETCERMIDLTPDRIVLRGYIHAPRFAKRQSMIDPKSVPDPSNRRRQFEAAAKMLRTAGYREVGFDWFERAEGAWKVDQEQGSPPSDPTNSEKSGLARTTLGFGAGASSRFPGGVVQNSRSTRQYIDAVCSCETAVDAGVSFDLSQRVRARAIEMLMNSFIINHEALRSEFGGFAEMLEPIVAEAESRFDEHWLRFGGGSEYMRRRDRAYAIASHLATKRNRSEFPAGTKTAAFQKN